MDTKRSAWLTDAAQHSVAMTTLKGQHSHLHDAYISCQDFKDCPGWIEKCIEPTFCKLDQLLKEGNIVVIRSMDRESLQGSWVNLTLTENSCNEAKELVNTLKTLTQTTCRMCGKTGYECKGGPFDDCLILCHDCVEAGQKEGINYRIRITYKVKC